MERGAVEKLFLHQPPWTPEWGDVEAPPGRHGQIQAPRVTWRHQTQVIAPLWGNARARGRGREQSRGNVWRWSPPGKKSEEQDENQPGVIKMIVSVAEPRQAHGLQCGQESAKLVSLGKRNTKNLELENKRGSQLPEQGGEDAKAARPVSMPSSSGLPWVSITAWPSGPHSNAKARPSTLLRLHPWASSGESKAQPFMHCMSDLSSLVGFMDLGSIGSQSCMFWRFVSEAQVLKGCPGEWSPSLWFSMRSSRCWVPWPLRVAARGGVYGEIVSQPLLPVSFDRCLPDACF